MMARHRVIVIDNSILKGTCVPEVIVCTCISNNNRQSSNRLVIYNLNVEVIVIVIEVGLIEKCFQTVRYTLVFEKLVNI